MLHVYCHQVKLCKAPNHQISSKRTTAGANFCARAKTARRAASVSPTHFDRRAGPLTISMCAPHSPATARARRVFHVGVLQRQLDQVACGLDRSVLAEDVGVARGRYATLHGLGAVIGCLGHGEIQSVMDSDTATAAVGRGAQVGGRNLAVGPEPSPCCPETHRENCG